MADNFVWESLTEPKEFQTFTLTVLILNTSFRVLITKSQQFFFLKYRVVYYFGFIENFLLASYL